MAEATDFQVALFDPWDEETMGPKPADRDCVFGPPVGGGVSVLTLKANSGTSSDGRVQFSGDFLRTIGTLGGSGVEIACDPPAGSGATNFNFLRLQPNVTGSNPQIAVSGDANVGLNVVPSGTGRLQENGVNVVLGATGSTDNALVRADGTGGKTIQGGTSMPTVDDSGNMTVGQNATVTGTLTANGVMSLGAAGALTIATGAISATKSYHKINTEASAATDDLDTINGGTDGMRLTLRANHAARTVVVKHATGNIRLDGSADFSLDNTIDTITLIYDDSLAVWLEISRSNNGT